MTPWRSEGVAKGTEGYFGQGELSYLEFYITVAIVVATAICLGALIIPWILSVAKIYN